MFTPFGAKASYRPQLPLLSSFPGELTESGQGPPLLAENLQGNCQSPCFTGGDFPGSPVVKNPPYDAGDAGSISGWGTKIPRAMEQLGLLTATTGPPQAATRESVQGNERSHITQ